jgi:N-acetyl-anhydromuramyl-L-alanine amidase AmpD
MHPAKRLYPFPILAVLAACCILSGCATGPAPGAPLERRGDEIMVCGQLFHTGAPVVLWTDPGGYDAYRTEKRFAPWDKSAWTPPAPPATGSPNRYGVRFETAGRGPGGSGDALPPELFEQVRAGGWDLPSLQARVDQFVIHYDVCGTSRQCFRVLHDLRNLSVHFMLDIDGTIYQTLDLKERAWHATTSNDRSVGIEIANIGAYPSTPGAELPQPLRDWYSLESTPAGARTIITIPPAMGDGGVRMLGICGPLSPARPDPIVGVIQGQRLVMYDLTNAQYDSLRKLTATLCAVFPNLTPDYPRDAAGGIVTTKLPDDQLAAYRGILGHFHIQDNKADPGPAFQWDRILPPTRH